LKDAARTKLRVISSGLIKIIPTSDRVLFCSFFSFTSESRVPFADTCNQCFEGILRRDTMEGVGVGILSTERISGNNSVYVFPKKKKKKKNPDGVPCCTLR
jgi:hypothetical protein